MSMCDYCLCACSKERNFPWIGNNSNEQQVFKIILCDYCEIIAMTSLGGAAYPTYGNNYSQAYLYIFPVPFEDIDDVFVFGPVQEEDDDEVEFEEGEVILSPAVDADISP